MTIPVVGLEEGSCASVIKANVTKQTADLESLGKRLAALHVSVSSNYIPQM